MNLVEQIHEIEEKIESEKYRHEAAIKELKSDLATLRKLNTVCEKCNGKGKYLRSRTCAEDYRPDPDDPTDYIDCLECGGAGKLK